MRLFLICLTPAVSAFGQVNIANPGFETGEKGTVPPGWIVPAAGASAGTNGNVNPFTLPGGFTVTWTGMKVLKHDGSQHHGMDIIPTVPASRTRKSVAEGKDEVLIRGLEVVKSTAQ